MLKYYCRNKQAKIENDLQHNTQYGRKSTKFIRKEIDAGNLKARRLGRRVIVFVTDFEAYLQTAKTAN